jgi:GGDEF domain-containing protein
MPNLSYLQLGSILALAITFSFIVGNLLSNRRSSYIVMLLFIIMLFIIGMKYLAPNYYQKFAQKINKIDLYLLIANGVIALFSIIDLSNSSVLRHRINMLIRYGIHYSDNNFVAYLSKKNHLIYKSRKLDMLFRRKNEKDHQLELKHILVNGGELKREHFEKALVNCRGVIEQPANWRFVYGNGLVDEMNLVRKPILNDRNQLLGYVLIDITNRANAKVSTVELKKNLFIYLDMLNQPLAYFDSDEKLYVVTRCLAEFLSLKNNRLTINDFRKLVHQEDLYLLQEQKLENNKINNVFIRLQTKVGYVWFEQLSASFNGFDFIVLRKADFGRISNLNLGTYESLVNMVNHLCETKEPFGLVMINLTSIPSITNEYGKEVADIVTTKFITQIANNLLNNQAQIYKLGVTDYIFVLDKIDYLDLIVRDLGNKTSDLLTQNIIVNKYNLQVNSKIAVVYSHDVTQLDTNTILKITFDTLKEASDPDFNKPYSIYQPTISQEKAFSLEELGIDLDHDDLSVFK